MKKELIFLISILILFSSCTSRDLEKKEQFLISKEYIPPDSEIQVLPPSAWPQESSSSEEVQGYEQELWEESVNGESGQELIQEGQLQEIIEEKGEGLTYFSCIEGKTDFSVIFIDYNDPFMKTPKTKYVPKKSECEQEKIDGKLYHLSVAPRCEGKELTTEMSICDGLCNRASGRCDKVLLMPEYVAFGDSGREKAQPVYSDCCTCYTKVKLTTKRNARDKYEGIGESVSIKTGACYHLEDIEGKKRGKGREGLKDRINDVDCTWITEARERPPGCVLGARTITPPATTVQQAPQQTIITQQPPAQLPTQQAPPTTQQTTPPPAAYTCDTIPKKIQTWQDFNMNTNQYETVQANCVDETKVPASEFIVRHEFIQIGITSKDQLFLKRGCHPCDDQNNCLDCVMPIVKPEPPAIPCADRFSTNYALSFWDGGAKVQRTPTGSTTFAMIRYFNYFDEQINTRWIVNGRPVQVDLSDPNQGTSLQPANNPNSRQITTKLINLPINQQFVLGLETTDGEQCISPKTYLITG